MSNSNRLTASTAQPENCVGIFFFQLVRSTTNYNLMLLEDRLTKSTLLMTCFDLFHMPKSFTCILYISSDDVNLSTIRDFALMFILRWLSLY